MDPPPRGPSASASGWEAALSEAIHVGGTLRGEAAALAAIKDHRSIVYLATDEGDDVAYEAEASGAPETADLPTHGFKGLAALGRAGHEEVVWCPLRTERLRVDDAEVLDGLLLRLQRPTLVMCSSGRRASAAKAIYLGRKADMTQLSEALIQAAASDQYFLAAPSPIIIPDETQQQHQQQQQAPPSLGDWHRHPRLRGWVEEALAAKAGPGTEEAREGGAGVQCVGGGGEEEEEG